MPETKLKDRLGPEIRKNWHGYAKRLGKLDWSKSNSLWEDGRRSCEPWLVRDRQSGLTLNRNENTLELLRQWPNEEKYP
jgi:hypothetical protein